MCSVEACEHLVKEILKENSELNVLLSKSGKGGESFKIECKRCDNIGVEGSARAYLSDRPSIVLCSNRLPSKRQIENALTHEATHAFDYFTGKCNFSSCEGLAYSEVRAARNGECSGYFPLEWFRERCIHSHASRSTSNLFPVSGNSCVEKVFKEAMSDNSPTTDGD